MNDYFHEAFGEVPTQTELLEIWQRPFLLEGNNLAYRVQGKLNITNKIFFKQ